MNAAAYPSVLDALKNAAEFFAANDAVAEIKVTMNAGAAGLIERFIGRDGLAFAESRYDENGCRKNRPLRSW